MENGPSIGMVPQRSLFERSMTLRFESEASSLGMDPFSLLLFRRRNLRDFNLANDFGICPSRWFPYKSMLIKFFKLPNSSGIFPSKLFLYSSRYWRCCSRPSSGPRGPEILEFPKSRRITRLRSSQVTWNQVQGLTRVGSQLWSTLVGSESFVRSACKASPSELVEITGDAARRKRTKEKGSRDKDAIRILQEKERNGRTTALLMVKNYTLSLRNTLKHLEVARSSQKAPPHALIDSHILRGQQQEALPRPDPSQMLSSVGPTSQALLQ